VSSKAHNLPQSSDGREEGRLHVVETLGWMKEGSERCCDPKQEARRDPGWPESANAAGEIRMVFGSKR
jgi:hypothetical protein